MGISVSCAGDRLDRPEYHFFHRDHLGNKRMDVGENGSVWQICHYYPYGMLMGDSYIPERQRWKFGDKELDRVSGLDLSDFEARAYDPALGRFLHPDPLADKYIGYSPLLYCAANPLIISDPTGMDWVKNNKSNNYEWMDNVSNAKQTPLGYSYIGATPSAILDDLNIPHQQRNIEASIGAGLDSDRGFVTLMPTSACVIIYVVASANISSSRGAISEHNQSGMTFDGIFVTTIVSQKSLHTNHNYSIDYNGGMSVNIDGFQKIIPILPPNDGNPRYNIEGYNSRVAKINIPVNRILNTRNATVRVELGTLRMTGFIPLLPITKTFNLFKK